jgi:hypothetical protein
MQVGHPSGGYSNRDAPPGLMRTLQCQDCGQHFGCGVGSGSCWCSHVEVDGGALAKLTGGAGDCLCPDCLALAAPAPVVPPPAA